RRSSDLGSPAADIGIMQTQEENLEKLCNILQQNAKLDVVVGAKTMLATDLGIDSAQLMEILLEVEDEFDISIPLNVLPNVVTVEDLSIELEKLLGT
ncbi:MAG: phosphopantetheine-binding protein, partial [Gammaproteobacteria bacterium]